MGVVIVLLAIVLTGTLSAGITIEESNRNELRFSWNQSRIDTTSFSSDGKRYTSLSFKESNCTFGANGETAIPGYNFHIGVPRSGFVSVHFTPQTTGTLHLTHSPSNVTTEETIQADGWISVDSYSTFRSMRTARIFFTPVRYDAGTGNVTYVKKGTGIIRFPASGTYRIPVTSSGDYEKMLERMLLNYDIASGWRKTERLSKRKASSLPLEFNTSLYSFKVGDGHTGFNESTTDENGLLKITAGKITDLFGTTSVDRIKLYAAYKGMLPHELPEDGSIPDGVIEVPLYRVDHNNNGIFNDDDYVLAYVSGSSDWMVEQRNKDPGYNMVLDCYDDSRTYWLSTSGGTGASFQRYESRYAVPDTILSHVKIQRRFGQPNVRRQDDQGSQKWYLKILDENQNRAGYHVDLPGLDPSLPGTFIYYGKNAGGGTVNIRLGDEKIATLAPQSTVYPITEWADSVRFSYNNVIHDDVNDDNKDRVELDYFDITYSAQLHVGKDSRVQTILPSLDDTVNTIVGYTVAIDRGSVAYILRVPENEGETRLVAKIDGDETSSYQWIDSTIYGVRYVIVNEKTIITLDEVVQYEAPTISGKYLVHDLRSTDRSTDYLIITHADFIPAADSLAAHKKTVGFDHPVVADVADIYRWFSGGDKDVTALRNFIGYVQRYWKNSAGPDYVVLMGSGHYDPKKLLTDVTDFVPVFIEDDENYEDYFTRTAPVDSVGHQKPQLAIGRLPCSTPEQAWAMVHKIVAYESPDVADFSEWRNRMLFVADDDMQGLKYDGLNHHLSSDRTVELIETLRPTIDIRKVYLFEFEWDQAKQKPGASRALINEINNGVGYINFYGHGSYMTWTDEYILTQEMVPGMSNRGQFPVVSAFSCSVGKFDVPGTECLSGALTKADGRGAIATISSTRESRATPNETLAKSFYRSLLDSNSSRSIGMALMESFAITKPSGYSTYSILGDPSVRAVRPTTRISLSIDDPDDTLSALQKIAVTGKMMTSDGKRDKRFGNGDGYVSIGLFNAPDTTIRKDGDTNAVKYVLPGTPVFSGKTSVVNGAFSQTILIPQNLTFHRDGVKLIAYAWSENGERIGTGYRADLVFGGSCTTCTIDDTTGPRITIRPVYDNERFSGTNASFTDHITVQTPVTCEVELFDESGIDAAGIGPEEGVTLEIRNIAARQNVNNKMQFKNGDFRRGIVSVVYEEEIVGPGTYDLIVTARDLVGNLSKAKFTLKVTQYDVLKLDHVLNFPNPVRLGKPTRFYCHTNYTSHEYYRADIRLTIKIYTLGGRLLRVIRNARNGEGWDCRDQRGNILSPDVYLYQITAEDIIQRKTEKSKIMKLVILPPR